VYNGGIKANHSIYYIEFSADVNQKKTKKSPPSRD